MPEYAGKRSNTQNLGHTAAHGQPGTPGKQTLVEQAYAATTAATVQRRASPGEAADAPGIHAAAAQGVATASSPLPHADAIQRAFGHHDVSAVQSHTGSDAAASAGAMGAEAYATGNHVVFAGSPSLHTAAHEAAHVVQQQAGVQLKGGVGAEGDSYERHADAVADAVTRGESAQGLLDQVAGAPGGGSGGGAVQRKLGGSLAAMTLEGFRAQLKTHGIERNFREARELFARVNGHAQAFVAFEKIIEVFALTAPEVTAPSSQVQGQEEEIEPTVASTSAAPTDAAPADPAPQLGSSGSGPKKAAPRPPSSSNAHLKELVSKKAPPPPPPGNKSRLPVPSLDATTESPVVEPSVTRPAPRPIASVSSGLVRAEAPPPGASQPDTAHQADNAPAEARAVIERFNATGVFVSSIQSDDSVGTGVFKKSKGTKDDLLKFFQNAVGPGQGVTGNRVTASGLTPAQNAHPTNNWSLAHRDLIANYYKLADEDGNAHTDWAKASRSIATISDPTRIGDKFLSNSASGLSFGKDAMSSSGAYNVDGKPVYSQADGTDELARLLAAEKTAQQETPGKSAQNTEIKTLGFDPNAVVGFIATFIDKERDLIQRAVNQIQSTHDKFPVFTWKIEDNHTVLQYVETITRQAP